MAQGVAIPGIAELLLPTLKAAQALGSMTHAELVTRVLAGFTEEQRAVLSGGSRGEHLLHKRTPWAIWWLKEMGALDKPGRAIYRTNTEGARYLGMDETAAKVALRTAYARASKADRRKRARKKAAKPTRTVSPPEQQPIELTEGDAGRTEPLPEDRWKAAVLEKLKKMAPAAFERLARRILQEAGFQEVNILGRTGDGGIDGVGVYRTSLTSFPIYFQCRQRAESIGAGAVRDFRGAMAGRGDKGLIITTGTFTLLARAEATKDGAPPVDLIDGEKLCDLIVEYKLGVRVVERVVKDITVDESFFETL